MFFLLFFSPLLLLLLYICRYVMGTNFTFTRNVIERKNLYRGSFLCCCCYYYLGSGKGGDIKHLRDADEKKKETILGVVSSAIQFPSRWICFLIILLIISLFFLILSLKGISLDYTKASSIVYWNMMMKKNQFKVLVHAQHPWWYFSLSDLLEDSFIMFLYLCWKFILFSCSLFLFFR